MSHNDIENHMVLPEAAPNEPPEPSDREKAEAEEEVLERMLRVDVLAHKGAGDMWVGEALAQTTPRQDRELAGLLHHGCQHGYDNAEIGRLIREHVISYITETADLQGAVDEQIARNREERRAEAVADREFEADRED